MEVKESKGIILYNRNYREDDKLVKIFTETVGKRMFFVKHISKSKLVSVVQPLVVANFILKINPSGLSYIEDYKEVKVFKNINNDLFKLSYATYIVSLADAAIVDGEKDAYLFDFLVRLLELMEEGLDYEILTNIFELQILERFGVGLNFNDCVFCHKQNIAFDFSYKYSGVLCSEHYVKDMRRSHLDPNLIFLINRLKSISFVDLRRISIKDDMKRKLRFFIDEIYDSYVGIHLKSKKFIDDLSEWGNILQSDNKKQS